jgi:hypothetical protein
MDMMGVEILIFLVIISLDKTKSVEMSRKLFFFHYLITQFRILVSNSGTAHS